MAVSGMMEKPLGRKQRPSRPIRVGLIGAGFYGRAVARNFGTGRPGLRLAAIANRTASHAVRAFREAGVDDVLVAENGRDLENAIAAGRSVVTTDPTLLAAAKTVDAIVEATGTIAPALETVMTAIAAGKSIILANTELDGTLGPILKQRADAHSVVFTSADGDQPGVTMNLYRSVVDMGFSPHLCGNIKGLYDRFRTPATQAAFAKAHGLTPGMATSFADGTKLALEQATIANGTGMRVARRGMLGPEVPAGTPIEEASKILWPSLEADDGQGLVDYIVGASPGGGVFVIATPPNRQDAATLSYYKMGEGPYYCFYRPYHLCHFELPGSIVRAVVDRQATLAPRNGPVVGVVAAAKRSLRAGERLDGIGGDAVYGLAENQAIIDRDNLLPIGLSEGAQIKRAVAVDEVLSIDDVAMNTNNRMALSLYREQQEQNLSQSQPADGKRQGCGREGD